MTRLYEIANEYQTALESIADEDTGEINEQALETLNALSADLKEKGIAIASFIRNIDADREAIDAESKRLAARKTQLAKRIDWLNNYLKSNMEACGISEISCPLFSIKMKTNPPSVNITDEDQVPPEYVKRREVVSIDKAQMLADLKNGLFIPGVELKRGTRLDIR